MKKILFLAVAAVCFFACEPKGPEIQVLPVGMSSFGFYAEDNADALRADFTVNTINSSSISITFPYGVTKENIKHLIPRFEVTEGASVTVNGEEAVSGKTAFDFTEPVDFIVSLNEKSNAYYSVNCSISSVKSFAFSAESETAGLYDHIMRVSPTDNLPYFITNDSTKTTADRFPHLYRFNGTSIESVSTLTQSRADHPTMNFSPEGTLYVAFQDYSEAASKGNTSVMKIEGNSASYVGNAGDIYKATGSNGYPIGILPLSDKDIYVGHILGAATGGLARRALNIAHYTGSWQNEITAPGRTSRNYGYSTICKYKNGVGYMMVYNQNAHNVDLYKFTPGIEAVANDLKIIRSNSGSEYLPAINLRAINFDVASNGDIYMLVCGQYISDTYNPAVIKYEQATGRQTIIGGAISDVNIDDAGSRSAIITLDSYDMPYIAIRKDERALLYYLDAETYEWKNIQIADVNANRPQIEFAPDGTAYYCFTNESGRAVLYKAE